MISALKQLGYDPQIHKEAKNLQGYQGDVRKEKANIIIPRSQYGSASNDIGFLKKEDGTFEAIVSQYDSAKWKKEYNELVKHYSIGVVKKMTKNGPYQWDTVKTDENGITTIKIKIRE